MIVDIVGADEFDSVVSKNPVVLVDFWATWCGPCKMLLTSLDELNGMAKDVTIAKVDVDKNQELAAKYEVHSVPAMVLFKDGKEVKSRGGYTTAADLLSWINQ
jgi:thioredoxin 1